MICRKWLTLKTFYKDKKILLTGHTGFKGSWLSKILSLWGSDVLGYSLLPPTNPNLFECLNLENSLTSIIGDVTDLNYLKNVFDEFNPDIVIHMAAQPLVLEGYRDPVNTYKTNVMGTVNICECVRQSESVKSFLNVTTDKVYENKDLDHAFIEDEKLDGFDPYSNSKSCSELVTHCYNNSFFENMNISCSTARAGNVIGGGDFAKDRIIPDCVRAAINENDIIIRNPHSLRPYQHVLEPLSVYLQITMKQYADKSYAGNYNVGPDECDSITTGELADLFCKYYGNNLKWIDKSDPNAPHEASYLKLDNSKIKKTFNYEPKWNISKAIEKTVEWTKIYAEGGNLEEITTRQIMEFF